MMGLVAQGKGVYTIFLPTLKMLKSASILATWALGLWGGGMVIVWHVQGVCVSLIVEERLPEYDRLYIKSKS